MWLFTSVCKYSTEPVMVYYLYHLHRLTIHDHSWHIACTDSTVDWQPIWRMRGRIWRGEVRVEHCCSPRRRGLLGPGNWRVQVPRSLAANLQGNKIKVSILEMDYYYQTKQKQGNLGSATPITMHGGKCSFLSSNCKIYRQYLCTRN